MKQYIPWIAAGGSCVLIALSALFAVSTAGKNAGEVPQGGKDPGVAAQEASLEHRLMSLLALEPKPRREAFLLAAMIENHADARPYQQGLPEAEVVFEMIAEGDITRFLALYRSDRLPPRIGPIRSLRPHFVAVLLPYRPLLLHIGGNAFAYDALANAPWITHHDGMRYDGETYERDPSAPAPHNLFMGRDRLLPLLERMRKELRGVTFPLYPGSSEIPLGAEKAQKIRVDLSNPLHNVTFTYDAVSSTYRRAIQAALEQSAPANVLILETLVDGYGQVGYIPWTKTIGEGKMLLFRNGKKYEARWKREETAPFVFTNAEGKTLPLAPGQVWVMFLPSLELVRSE